MNKKPPELPNIEDATLRACLAPLMEAIGGGNEAAGSAPLPHPVAHASLPRRTPRESNDNPLPEPETTGMFDREHAGLPGTLAEWRLQADDEFGAFRMIELFLSMSDTELQTAAEDFPKQIGGTMARIAGIKRRLAAQYDRATAAAALLERAMARAAVGPASD